MVDSYRSQERIMNLDAVGRRVILLPVFISVVFGLPKFCISQSKDDSATAERILARWAEALGGEQRLRNIRNVYTKANYSGTAGSGVVETWQTARGQTKQSNELTSGHEINVFDGKKGWVSYSGRVREYSPEETSAFLSGAYFGSNSHLIPGRLPGRVEFVGEDSEQKNYILRIAPDQGNASEIYIDKISFLPTRKEERLTRTNLTVEVQQWRVTDGVKFPSLLRMTTPEGYDAKEVVADVRLNLPLSDEFFGRPPDAPPDYHFDDARSFTRIPIETDGGHIFVQAKVVGSAPLRFALDTAASGSLIDSSTAAKLGLKLFGQPAIVGAGGAVTGSYTRDIRVDLIGVTLNKQDFLTLPLDPLSAVEGRQIDGIFGYDFFHRFVVEIDYARKFVTLYEPDSYKYTGSGTTVPFTLHADQPYIKADLRISDSLRINGEFVIDTGSSNSVMLSKPFTEKHNILVLLERKLESRARGVGGDFPLTIGRIAGVRIGDFDLNQPLTLFPNAEITAPGKAGNIGGKILRRFRVIFDYSRQRMILEPNIYFSDPDRADNSGISLTADPPNFRTVKILRVRDNSPASAAGLRADDVLLSVDGKNAGQIGLAKLREMFRGADLSYRLRIRQLNTVRNVKIKLKQSI